MKQQKNLKPIVTNSNKYTYNSKDKIKQVILLKAMEVTQDPKKLKEMIGVKTVAEVYRTLDKLSIRKEYHDALGRSGFSLDKVVTGIMKIAEESEKDDTKLKAYQVIMKSVGLDKYESADLSEGGTWEEELIQSIENSKKTESLEAPVEDYEVTEPEMPEKMKKLREEEDELTKSIYGG